MGLKVIILAAGKGTRMRSRKPKVLQTLAHQSLLQHVITTVQQLNCSKIITVIGHDADSVKASVTGTNITFVMQTEQLGTGHAVMTANEHYSNKDTVLILYGDVPLTSQDTLNKLLARVNIKNPIALLTVILANSKGYGRIVRNSKGIIESIIEQKEASTEQLLIKEVNTGIIAVNGGYLKQWLAGLSSDNTQNEYYLTDIIAIAVKAGFTVNTVQPASEIEVIGVNDKQQLQMLERRYQYTLAEQLMCSGATLLDASRLDIRGRVTVGQDVEIDVNVILLGEVTLGDNVTIGSNCVLNNVQIASNTIIHPFSHLEACTISENCIIGPYARLRPGTKLANNVKIGNFVETKKAIIGEGSKVHHLSYIGDAKMGSGVNIGAGVITCNYDGVNKYQTTIGNNVFVGSGSQLIAPVTIGNSATIGAGSTITKDAPSTQLTLSRSRQQTLKGWSKPTKN